MNQITSSKSEADGDGSKDCHLCNVRMVQIRQSPNIIDSENLEYVLNTYSSFKVRFIRKIWEYIGIG